jgi:hypothetical protein
MHLDRTNNASKNYCENANILARDDETLVVLAPLRRHFRGVETTIFLYAIVKIWRQCHLVFHELKFMLKCYTYLAELISERAKQAERENVAYSPTYGRQTLLP